MRLLKQAMPFFPDIIKEPTKAFELNPADALQTLMDHVEAYAREHTESNSPRQRGRSATPYPADMIPISRWWRHIKTDLDSARQRVANY